MCSPNSARGVGMWHSSTAGAGAVRESSGPSLPCHRATHRRRAPGVHDTWAGSAPSIGRNTDVSRSGRHAAGGRALLLGTRVHGVGPIEGRGRWAGPSGDLPIATGGLRWDPDVPGEWRPPGAEHGQLCRRRRAPARGFWSSGGPDGHGRSRGTSAPASRTTHAGERVYATMGGDRVLHLASWASAPPSEPRGAAGGVRTS
jgi:hypothetical protein